MRPLLLVPAFRGVNHDGRNRPDRDVPEPRRAVGVRYLRQYRGLRLGPQAGRQPGEGTLSKQKGSRAARDLQEAVNFIRWQDGLGREVYIRMGSVKNPGIGKSDKLGQDISTGR